MLRERSWGRKIFLTSFIALLSLGMSFTAQAAEEGTKSTSWKKGAGIAVLLKESDEGGTQEVSETQESQDADKTQTAGKDDGAEEGRKESQEVSADEKEQEDDRLVMANVNQVMNVRREPDTQAELAGYLYADCGGEILEQKDGWTKLQSGDLTGWAKDDYLLFGEEAQAAAKDSGRTVATTTTGALRIRKEPSMTAGVYDLLEEGAEYEVVDAEQLAFSDGMEISDEWVAVDYEGKTGFVSAEYVKVEFLVDHGETVEQVEQRQEEERLKAEALRKEKEKAAAAEKKEKEQREIEKVQAQAAADDVLLAALIQCEAGDEVYEGQVAVGAVVMNRVKSGAYPNTIKDVIFASGQFTPAGSGKLGKVVASGNVKASCLQAAREAIAGVSPVGTATHFRRAGSREGIVIGHHVFW